MGQLELGLAGIGEIDLTPGRVDDRDASATAISIEGAGLSDRLVGLRIPSLFNGDQEAIFFEVFGDRDRMERLPVRQRRGRLVVVWVPIPVADMAHGCRVPLRAAAGEPFSELAFLVPRPLRALLGEAVDDKAGLVVAGHEAKAPGFLEPVFHSRNLERGGDAGEQHLTVVALRDKQHRPKPGQGQAHDHDAPRRSPRLRLVPDLVGEAQEPQGQANRQQGSQSKAEQNCEQGRSFLLADAACGTAAVAGRYVASKEARWRPFLISLQGTWKNRDEARRNRVLRIRLAQADVMAQDPACGPSCFKRPARRL